MPVGARLVLLGVSGLALAAAAAILAGQGGGDLAAWLQTTQRDLHRQLAAAMRAVSERGAVAGWGLVAVSFLYGVFHAAGPGHGKVVIATYLASHESAFRRGAALSVAASLAQGLAAVVLVEGALAVLDLSMRETQTPAPRWRG